MLCENLRTDHFWLAKLTLPLVQVSQKVNTKWLKLLMLLTKIHYMINIWFLDDSCAYIKFNLNVFGETWYIVFDLTTHSRNETTYSSVFNYQEKICIPTCMYWHRQESKKAIQLTKPATQWIKLIKSFGI